VLTSLSEASTGSAEHSRNVGLVAGPGANAATCRGMYGVEVLEVRSVKGAMDSLTGAPSPLASLARALCEPSAVHAYWCQEDHDGF
jgi:hypothetical protein